MKKQICHVHKHLLISRPIISRLMPLYSLTWWTLMGRVLCFYKYITQDHTKSDVNKHGALAGIHRRLSIHFGVCGVLAQVPAS